MNPQQNQAQPQPQFQSANTQQAFSPQPNQTTPAQKPQPQSQPQPQSNIPTSGFPANNVPLAPQSDVNPSINQDNPSSTQSSLLISELRDGLIIMKDGSFRAVIACKSINYDLMSEPERDGIEYGYK